MPTYTPKSLIDKLNPTAKTALSQAAGLCMSKSHFHVEVEHWLLKLLDAPGGDLEPLLTGYDIHLGQLRRELGAAIDKFKTGSGRQPEMAQEVLDVVREAWLAASLGLGATRLRSAHILAGMLAERAVGARIKATLPELGRLPLERLTTDLPKLLPGLTSSEADLPPADATGGGSGAAPAAGKPGTQALDQFTQNLTERARAGRIDPVVGRDDEIRQAIDILKRRRQNNPILVGEAGVGKTAVVEGMALRIAAKDVPNELKNVELRTLDLGLLQAGAGVKGEFENRLKSVIAEVQASPTPIILFIDEAHTLIGAGGQQGQGDAANLLKPALARGELRTVAATTLAEYKQYFEKDAALKRRFQPVRVDEPDEPKARRMLRGLLATLEKHHKVRILDEAAAEAVRLSARYIADRQLPDKAITLLDTACARVSLSQSATPPALEDCRREIEHLSTEIRFLERETAGGADHAERLTELRERLTAAETERAALEARTTQEREVVAKLRAAREALEALPEADPGREAKRTELATLRTELAGIQGESPLVHPVVGGDAVAEVVAAMTGIPLGKMVRDEVQTVLTLGEKLRDRVIGQDHALEAIAERVRTARADLMDPRRPIGVFMLVGPSGVGKTETAMALADLLYGGDRNMVTVNMSEYKEAAKISRLTGTAKGYVGYGEGGVLTNAVKSRPYSIVLLDEIEKADESVQEIFYQVFDKGTLANDTGDEVNFKNTIILITSNVGLDTIMKACEDPDLIPTADGLAEMIRPDLEAAFKPAFLGRMKVVPYFPLGDDVIKRIIVLQLGRIGKRLRENHKAAFEYSDAVVTTIASRCKEVRSGARNVETILSGTLLPAISGEILTRMVDGKPVTRVGVDVDAGGQFVYVIE